MSNTRDIHTNSEYTTISRSYAIYEWLKVIAILCYLVDLPFPFLFSILTVHTIEFIYQWIPKKDIFVCEFCGFYWQKNKEGIRLNQLSFVLVSPSKNTDLQFHLKKKLSNPFSKKNSFCELQWELGVRNIRQHYFCAWKITCKVLLVKGNPLYGCKR